MKNLQKKALVLSLLLTASVVTTPVAAAAPAWFSNSWNTTKNGFSSFRNKTVDIAKSGYTRTANGVTAGYGQVKNACYKGASYANSNRGKTALGAVAVAAVVAVAAFAVKKIADAFKNRNANNA